MIQTISQKISPFLPLIIDEVEWENYNLTLKGLSWHLRMFDNNWRLLDDRGLLLYGCYDNGISEALNQLKMLKIVKIKDQSTQIPSDPVLIFSNEYKLEVFSTMRLRPWIFTISSEDIYSEAFLHTS
jgi:hypothetical protein